MLHQTEGFLGIREASGVKPHRFDEPSETGAAG